MSATDPVAPVDIPPAPDPAVKVSSTVKSTPKRPARKGQAKTPTGKRSKPSFEKRSENTSSSFSYPLETFFEIETDINGLKSFVMILYSIIASFDTKITTLFTELELLYVSSISLHYRLCLLARNTKATYVSNMSDLKNAAEGILLPDVLCQFIETFGIVKTSSNVNVVPRYRDGNEVGRYRNLTPSDVLILMDYDPPDNHWGIDFPTIAHVQQRMSRAMKRNLEMREVNYKELSGRPEFLAGYSHESRTRITPLAPEEMNIDSLRLGAAYRLRNYDHYADWRGTRFPAVHTAPGFDPDMCLTTHIMKSLRS